MINWVKLLRHFPKKQYYIQTTKDDYWLVSYPRSGNTWMRLVLANYIWECPRITNLQDLQEYVPDIHYKCSAITPKKFGKKNRIIKSHEQYRSEYLQVIYIYRNPFDCAWSYFHFLKDWKGNYTQFDAFVADFLSGSLVYGSWADHLLKWYHLHSGKHIFLCYEDIVQNPRDSLRQIVSFIELEYDEQRAENAINNASAEAVAEVTNDRIFYGKEFTTFVRSPLGVGKKAKEQLRSDYASQFGEWNRLYEEFRSYAETQISYP